MTHILNDFQNFQDAFVRKTPSQMIEEQGTFVLKNMPQEQWVDFIQSHKVDFDNYFNIQEHQLKNKLLSASVQSSKAILEQTTRYFYQLRERISTVHFVLKNSENLPQCSRLDVIRPILEMENPSKIGVLEFNDVQNLEEINLVYAKNPISIPVLNEMMLDFFKPLSNRLIDPDFRHAFSNSVLQPWLKPLLINQAYQHDYFQILLPLLTQEDVAPLWNVWNQHKPLHIVELIDELKQQGFKVFPPLSHTHNELYPWFVRMNAYFNSLLKEPKPQDEEQTRTYFIEVLKRHPKLNEALFDNWTMLHFVASQFLVHETDILIQAGANPLMTDSFGLRPQQLVQLHYKLNPKKTNQETFETLCLKLEQAELQFKLPKSHNHLRRLHHL